MEETKDTSYEMLNDAIEKGVKSLDPKEDNYNDRAKVVAELYRQKVEAERVEVDRERLAFEKEREENEKERSLFDKVISIAKIFIDAGVAIGVGLFTAKINRDEFREMMAFESEGGIFTSSAGKQFSKEKRKERERDTFRK